MNEFDQFIKHDLKVKNYFRYTDDFIIVSENRMYLEGLLRNISEFLQKKLALRLHPRKITIRPLYQGIDFLGYLIFPKYRLLRTKTRRRILKNLKHRIGGYYNGTINKSTLTQSLQSYLGVLSHANVHKFGERLKNEFWFDL